MRPPPSDDDFGIEDIDEVAHGDARCSAAASSTQFSTSLSPRGWRGEGRRCAGLPDRRPACSVSTVFSPSLTASTGCGRWRCGWPALRSSRGCRKLHLGPPTCEDHVPDLAGGVVGAGVQIRPSRISPPPMPVPKKIPTTMARLAIQLERRERPAWRGCNRSRRNTGRHRAPSNSFFSGTSFQPRFGAKIDAARLDIHRARARPRRRPVTCLMSRSHSSTASLMQRAIRSMTASGPRWALVLTLARPAKASRVSKTPAWIWSHPDRRR